MKKTAYFGISLSSRKDFDEEIRVVNKCLKSFDVALNVFVDNHNFASHEDRKMKETALKEIDHCDFLIVELTKKAIGVGVEVGYAKAMNKPIVYLKKKDAKYSTTVGGISDFFIEYEDLFELEMQIKETVNSIVSELKK